MRETSRPGGEEMNRAYFIILVPALLVIVGYLLVFRSMGLALPYVRLIVPLILLLAAASWWLVKKRQGRKEVKT